MTTTEWVITEAGLNKLFEGGQNENIQSSVTLPKIAIIPITGPLFRYGKVFTSYETVSKEFVRARDDPDIKAIIFNIDSCGGQVNGCAELANLIYEARSKKPITAFVSGDAASGEYWLASAAEKIVISETSGLGSIGVIGVFRKADNQTVEIVSSQSPYKCLDAESEEGKIKLQVRIDAIAEIFIKTVARNRSFEVEEVLSNFGAGDILIGQHAVNAGLADETGSLERLIITINKEVNMNIETLATDHPDIVANIKTEAESEERKRIAAIINSEQSYGRDDLARYLAFGTNLSSTEAINMLDKAPKVEETKTNSFEQMMLATGNPKIIPAMEDDPNELAKRLANYKY